jgi:hypothetical protein
MTKPLKSYADPAERRFVSATWAHGLACDVDLGERALRADLARDRGGTGSGPDPDQLLRASLVSSLVIAYRTCAERLGVDLQSARLELVIEMMPAIAPAALGSRWRQIHGRILLRSASSKLDLWRVIELAHAQDAVLVNLSPAIARSFDLRIDRDEGSV